MGVATTESPKEKVTKALKRVEASMLKKVTGCDEVKEERDLVDLLRKKMSKSYRLNSQ